MKKNILFILIGVVFLANFVSASFVKGNYSIIPTYSKGDFLRGYVEINFSGESLNSTFTDNFGNSVKLGELINSSNYLYNCTPADCSSYYNPSNSEEIKTFTLNENSSKILGFRLIGKDITIDDIEFVFDSNAGESEVNQLKIDILNDGSYEGGNSAAGSGSSQANFGCFSPSGGGPTELIIDNTPYCQQVVLKEAPAFLIGGEFRAESPGTGNLTMELYDKDGALLDNCMIPNQSISSDFSSHHCQVDYPVLKEDKYYICVKTTSGTNYYRTKGYPSDDPQYSCGFKSYPPSDTFVGAYSLYAAGKYFGGIPETKINDTLSNGDSFVSMVEDYILEKYGGMDCSTGCLIPIKFLSSVDQTVTVKNISLKYVSSFGTQEIKELFDFSEHSPLISSSMQKLYLDNYFHLPTQINDYTYILKFNNQEVFRENISIENVSLQLYPLNTAKGFPTTFNVTGFSGDKYLWDFGDNSSDTSFISSITHTYSSIGNYTLLVKVINLSGGEFSKSFKIIVESPEKLINEELLNYQSTLNSLKTKISGYSPFARDVLNKRLKIEENQLKINELKANLTLAQSSEDLDLIIGELFSLNIPTTIFSASTNKVPFYVQKESIDLNSLAEISESSIPEGREEDLSNLLIFWNQENLNVKVSIESYFVKKGSEDFLNENVYEMTFTNKNSSVPYYVFFKDMEGLIINFPNVTNLSTGYKAITLDSEGTILFSFSDTTLSELPVFFGPSISELQLGNPDIPLAEDSKKKVLYLYLSLFGLVLFGFFIYYLLHRWYKIKYEKYLFKDRNNLYNVMIYVNNSKKQGLSNDQIRENLRKSGWNAEQIRYIMRKFHGKETGLPLFGSSKVVSTASEEKNPVKISTKDLRRDEAGFGYKP